jgi:hypothetical protein
VSNIRRLVLFLLLVSTTSLASASGIWTALTQSEDIGRSLIAVDPRNPKILYADGPGRRGLWRSNDGGKTWVAVDFVGIPLDITFVRGTIIVLTADAKIFLHLSTDGGLTWTTRSLLSPKSGVAKAVVAGPTLNSIFIALHCKGDDCLGGISGGVIDSLDGGFSWHAHGFGGPASSQLAINLGNPNNPVYVVNDDNRGFLSRRPASQPGIGELVNPGHCDYLECSLRPLRSVAASPRSAWMCFGGEAEILCYEDVRYNWDDGPYRGGPIPTPILAETIIAMAFGKSDQTLAVVTSNEGIYETSDLGTTWVSRNEGLIPEAEQIGRIMYGLDGALYCSSSTRGILKYVWPPQHRRAVRR